jgi:hypothetical protein
MAVLAECGAAVAFEIQRRGVEEGDRERAEQRFAVLIERLFDGVGAMAWLRAVLAIDRLTQPSHRLVGMVERESLHTGDIDGLLPCAGMAVGTGDHQPMQHCQVDGAFDIETEAPPSQVLA